MVLQLAPDQRWPAGRTPHFEQRPDTDVASCDLTFYFCREFCLVWGLHQAWGMARRRRLASEPQLDREELLGRRARRLARKGQYRKAALALRQLAALTQEPAHWVAMGAMFARARRVAEAIDALRQGLWLHRQRGAAARARTVARMIVALDPQDVRAARLARAA